MEECQHEHCSSTIVETTEASLGYNRGDESA